MYNNKNFWEWILNYCGYKYILSCDYYVKKLEDFTLIISIEAACCVVSMYTKNNLYIYETKKESLFELEAEAEDKYEIEKLSN